MANKFMTPGVYIQEEGAFPGSIVAVATAVPAFIGYTEKAANNGKSLLHRPIRITSLAAYHEHFGGSFDPIFKLELVDPEEGQDHHDAMAIGEKMLKIAFEPNHALFFYNSLRLFYANGGSACYIVSVGIFKADKGAKVDADELLAGLEMLKKEQEPTMVVIPEAVALGAKCYEVYRQVLKHCADLQNRVAILDVVDGDRAKASDSGDPVVQLFREGIGTAFLNYGAAYYPWLNTSIVNDGEITFLNFGVDEKARLQTLATVLSEKEAKALIDEFTKNDTAIQADIKAGNPEIEDDKKEAERRAYKKSKAHRLHLGLVVTSPTYNDILTKLTAMVNLLPPSSAMAGIYTMVDNTSGVWQSPANVSLNKVVKPAVNITHDEQEILNVDAISGKSINAIRTFPGVGTLVWGARTLDGNSLDWRYINVRRTMIMLEESIKLALRAYVFEPNDAKTWVAVKSMIVNFLTAKWKQGALAGATPEDAFEVQIGLGITMTSLDILEGRMLVSIKVAIVRPAEFIVITFEQQMQKS